MPRTAVRSASCRLKTPFLGEFVVDDKRLRTLDRLRRHVEFGVAPGQRRDRISVGEPRLDEPLLAEADPFELLLEAGDEGIRAEHDLDVFAVAALEFLAVDGPGKIQRQPVALGRLGVLLGRGIELAQPLDEIGDGLVDVGVGNFRHRTLDRNVVEAAELNRRQRLEAHREGEISRGAQRLFELLLAARKIQSRLGREAELVVFDDLSIGVGDRILHDVAHDLRSVKPLEMSQRSLARAKPLELNLAAHLLEFGVEPCG